MRKPNITDHIRRLWSETKRGASHPRRFGHHRLDRDAVSPTLLKAGGDTGLFHPDECRKLTVAELKRLASFPDGFKFTEVYVNIDPPDINNRVKNAYEQTLPGESHNKYFGLNRLSFDKTSVTVTKVGGTAGLYHPVETRRLNSGEYKRLSSFPDKFNFGLSWIDTINQIGNCVPPLLMRAVAEEIAGVKRKHEGASTMKRLLGTALRDVSKTYVADLDAAWAAHLAPRKRNAPTAVSLFAGCGGSSLGYSMAGYRELLAVEWDVKACATFRLNFPGVPVHEGDIALLTNRMAGKLTGLKPGELDILDGSPPCFAAGTPVVTRRGIIPIERVVKDDFVLTHKLRWRKVTRTMSRYAPTILVAKRIETTKDHRFYAREQLRLPNNKWVLEQPDWVNAEHAHAKFLAIPQNVKSTMMPASPDGFKYNEDFWYIVGRWLGDGWTRLVTGGVPGTCADRPSQNTSPIPCLKCGKPSRENRRQSGVFTNYCSSKCAVRHKGSRRKRPRSETYICTGLADETNLAKFIEKLNVAFCCSRDVATVRFTLSRKSLATWLNKWFGKGAYGKTVPGWALGMLREHRVALFKGYDAADGDGNGASSIGRCLITSMALLATTLGMTANLSGPFYDKRTEMFGRKVKTHPIWQLDYNEDDGRYTRSEGGIRWKKLRQLTTNASKRVKVFDLEVEEDHSFVADMFIVHNCQGFSTAGKRMVDDPRNQLFREYIRLLRYFRPKKLVMENVTGMVKGEMIHTFHEIMRELRSCGYIVKSRVLNAMHYGVPQARQRVIFIGSRVGEPEFPEPWSEPITVRDAWAGLDSASLHGESGTMTNFKHETYENTNQGTKADNVLGLFTRLAWESIAPTVMKQFGVFGVAGLYHPDEARPLTVGEYRRIASFPDGFRFGTWLDAVAQMGNCAPPPTHARRRAVAA